MIKNSSIIKKFLVPVLVMSSVLFCALGIFMVMNNKASIMQMMESRGQSVAGFVGNVSADYFAIFDFSDYEKFVKALESDPEVAFAVFYNNKMEPLTSVEKLPEDISSLMVYEREIKDESGSVLGHVKIGYKKEHLNSNINNNIIIIAAAMVIMLVLFTAGIVLIVKKLIIKRVRATVDMFKEIAQGDGDLTKRLLVDSDDELAEMGKWFNIFMENLREIVATVQINSERVSVASTELSQTAEALSIGSNEQRSQTEQVASAMAEMSQSITGVVSNASETSEASREASAIAGKGKEVVERTVMGMEKIAVTVKETSEIIEKLGKSSDEIGSILNVINDIAGQTNLLALNAAIEAARAGEHGRGFAVVADEVKKLADSTGQATKEIADMIKKIQADAEKSVQSMYAGREEVENGVKLAEEAQKALDMIVKASEKAATNVHMISRAAEEQSVSTERVTQNMESILTVSHQSTDGTAQIKMASDELEKLSLELHGKIGLFKV
ncbi:MAG: methyl-accepting chemotaxis protein [Nitrospirota bacterium]